MIVEYGIGRCAVSHHGHLVLLGNGRGPARGGVVRGAQQQGVVVLRDQLLGDRGRDRWAALIVADIDVQPVTGPAQRNAALGIDPVLAEEIALLGHLAAFGLAPGEGEDGADVNHAPQGRGQDPRNRSAGRKE